MSYIKDFIVEFLYVFVNKEYRYLQDVGAIIRKHRMLLKMSQSQLAFEVGLTLRQIQRIEKGDTNSGIIYYYRIAEALEVELKELLDF